jgi:hypothetical protein
MTFGLMIDFDDAHRRYWRDHRSNLKAAVPVRGGDIVERAGCRYAVLSDADRAVVAVYRLAGRRPRLMRTTGNEAAEVAEIAAREEPQGSPPAPFRCTRAPEAARAREGLPEPALARLEAVRSHASCRPQLKRLGRECSPPLDPNDDPCASGRVGAAWASTRILHAIARRSPMPATAQQVLERLESASRKLDLIGDIQIERGRRDVRQMRADDAAESAARRDQIERHADASRKFQSRYDAAYRSFGLAGAPPAMPDEFPGDHRRRMLQDMIDRLPSDHPWAGTKADSLNTETIKGIEPQVLEAAEAEGENPSFEHLPEDGSMIERNRVDSLGTRMVTFHGRKSFIADMSRPARHVLRFTDGSGKVIWGQPYSQRPGG